MLNSSLSLVKAALCTFFKEKKYTAIHGVNTDSVTLRAQSSSVEDSACLLMAYSVWLNWTCRVRLTKK